MNIDLLHLSILSRKQGALFSVPDPDVPSREAWLRKVFSEEIQFLHRQSQFHFVPETDSSSELIMAGRIGRQRVSHEASPPSKGLQPETREIWQAAAVVIDPQHHAEGQRVGMESGVVGRPLTVFQSLCTAINSFDHLYFIEVAGISNPDDFWSFVSENPSNIKSVTFEFIAPNMFGMDRDIDKFMREEAEKENARRVVVKLNNPDGLHLTKERLGQAAIYATEGGGGISSVTVDRRKFNSRRLVRSVSIPDDETGADGSRKMTLKQRIARAIRALRSDE